MPDAARRFARRVFTGAAVYGLVALLPQYLLEERLGHDFPPAITHPEHFYGFIGVAIAWQFAFLVIARDPMRYRALMPVAALEKIAFGGAALVLYALGRIAWPVLGAGVVDLVLATLFLAAYRATPRAGGMLP
ncbi:MAG: hypothetical protein ACREO3_01565 [Arenimonas sp.]